MSEWRIFATSNAADGDHWQADQFGAHGRVHSLVGATEAEVRERIADYEAHLAANPHLKPATHTVALRTLA